MLEEDLYSTVDRAFLKLRAMLSAQLPRGPSDIHPYSTGRMYAGLTFTKLTDGWQVRISAGVPYSAYALGWGSNGNRLQPRGPHEAINFRTIDSCLTQIRNMVVEGSV